MYHFVFKAFKVKRANLADILRNLQLSDHSLLKHRSSTPYPIMGRVRFFLSPIFFT